MTSGRAAQSKPAQRLEAPRSGAASQFAPLSLDRQIARLVSWTEAQVAQHPERYFAPELRAIAKTTPAEQARNAATVELFKRTFPTFLWTGFECSNPLLGEDRWDQNEVAGLYDRVERRNQIKIMGEGLGIQNARIAVPNHLMVGGTAEAPVIDWKSFDELYGDFRRGKVKVSVDLMHFGLPDIFHNPADKKQSDLLHPLWPENFAKIAEELVEKYPDIPAVTIINEPFVTNNFSASHWNEAVPGNEAFIDRALLMAKAATMARDKIEARLEQTGKRMVFLHNESCEWRSDDPDFNNFKRFLTSDLILGGDWLMEGDFRKSDMFQWMAANYDPAGKERLEKLVQEIKNNHLEFQAKYGKTMKADTVFGMDYYVTCEAGPGVSHDPEKYLGEAQKTRKGLYEMGRDYYARYRLPLSHAETNMREEKADAWMTQQLVELGALHKSGIPMLGATWYSLMDQVGWENGLNGGVLHSVEEAKDAGRLNPIGLITLEGHEPRASAKLMASLGRELAR